MSKSLLARVLIGFVDTGVQVSPNDLVEGEETLIGNLYNAGAVDTNPAAVDYCKGLNKKPIKITGAENPIAEEQAAEDAAKKAKIPKKAKPENAGNGAAGNADGAGEGATGEGAAGDGSNGEGSNGEGSGE